MSLEDILRSLLRPVAAVMGGSHPLIAFLRRLIAALVVVAGGNAVAIPRLLTTTVQDAALNDGAPYYVVSQDQLWILDKTSAAAITDGVLVVATGSGTGRWIQYPYRSLFRTTWVIDQATGSNADNTGAPGSPLASYPELQRRLGIHRGQIPTQVAGVTVTQVGNYIGNVHLDWSPFALCNPIVQGQGTAGVAGTITATAITAGVRTINSAAVLALGTAVRIDSNGAIGFVVSSTGGGPFTYEVSAFTLPTTGAVYVPAAEAFTTTTPSTIDGEVYVRCAGSMQFSAMKFTQTSGLTDGLLFAGGTITMISCHIVGATAANQNRIEGGANVFVYGTQFEMASQMRVLGVLQHQTGNLYRGAGAGMRVKAGGRGLFVGGTAAGGDGTIMQGPTAAAERSFLRVDVGGTVQIGTDAGTAGQLIARACTSNIWVEAGGKIRQTALAGVVPLGASAVGIGTTECIRIDTDGEYIFPTLATVPGMTPGTAGQDINLGGYYITFANAPATVGIDTPGLVVDLAGVAIAGTIHACTSPGAAGSVQTFNLQKPMSGLTRIKMNVTCVDVTGSGTTGFCTQQVVNISQILVISSDITLGAACTHTLAAHAVQMNICDPANGGMGARILNAA